MRNSQRLLTAAFLAATLALPASPAFAAADDPIVIPDPILQACLEDAGIWPATEAEADWGTAGADYIRCDGVSDLTGLGFYKRIEVFHFPNSQVSDLSPIEGMDGLEQIAFATANNLTDLTPLTRMRSLEVISLDIVPGVTDLSPSSTPKH